MINYQYIKSNDPWHLFKINYLDNKFLLIALKDEDISLFSTYPKEYWFNTTNLKTLFEVKNFTKIYNLINHKIES